MFQHVNIAAKSFLFYISQCFIFAAITADLFIVRPNRTNKRKETFSFGFPTFD
jgi:hypothetical protein